MSEGMSAKVKHRRDRGLSISWVFEALLSRSSAPVI